MFVNNQVFMVNRFPHKFILDLLALLLDDSFKLLSYANNHFIFMGTKSILKLQTMYKDYTIAVISSFARNSAWDIWDKTLQCKWVTVIMRPSKRGRERERERERNKEVCKTIWDLTLERICLRLWDNLRIS